jgi:hypothetical protein
MPPKNLKLSYPCIVYQPSFIDRIDADNTWHIISNRYQLMFITSDLETDIPEKLIKLDKCSFERSYPAENLYHYIYQIYF